MKNLKGFTLIELLVVVLIIGILAAVALPKYERAVKRSRAAEAWQMLDTMKRTYEECLMANGLPWKCQDMNLWSVTVPERSKHFFYSIAGPVGGKFYPLASGKNYSLSIQDGIRMCNDFEPHTECAAIGLSKNPRSCGTGTMCYTE